MMNYLNFLIFGNSEILESQKNSTMQLAFAQGTFKNLQVQWKTFQVFCDEVSDVSFPVQLSDLLVYMQYLSNKMKAPQTVSNYVNGLRILHVMGDHNTDVFYSLEAKLLLRAIRRSKLHRVKQAAPITVEILLRLANVVDFSDPEQQVIWTAILIMFFAMLRSSNLVPKSQSTFDSDKQLCKKDVILSSDIMVIAIRWSKVIQFAQREFHIPVFAIEGSRLCPVSAVSCLLENTKNSKSQSLFVVPCKKSKFVQLTYGRVSLFMKKWVADIGLDASKFSLHSLRRGSASLAFKAHVPGELIKTLGDWSSDAYLRYLDISVNQRCEVAQAIRDSVSSL